MSDRERSELEKLEAGEPYMFLDEEVAARKEGAVVLTRVFNDADPTDHEAQDRIIRRLLGSTGAFISVQQPFYCDYGPNIHVGDGFLTNDNVTILDIAPVRIGEHVMIGPNSLISTVGHPLSRRGRREWGAFAKPVTIGDDVWIGANVTILPGGDDRLERGRGGGCRRVQGRPRRRRRRRGAGARPARAGGRRGVGRARVRGDFPAG